MYSKGGALIHSCAPHFGLISSHCPFTKADLVGPVSHKTPISLKRKIIIVLKYLKMITVNITAYYTNYRAVLGCDQGIKSD